MDDQLKAGDVVVLRSGGPRMTVASVGSKYEGGTIHVWCEWFDGKHRNMGEFTPESLKSAE